MMVFIVCKTIFCNFYLEFLILFHKFAHLFLKPERMRYEATSTEAALAANGRIADAVTPWHLIVDTDAETVTVRKRNKYLIGVDEEVLSFRFIRNIRIDTHLIGADITIQAVGGSVTAYCLSKSDCKRIKQMLMEYNGSQKEREGFLI